MSVSNNVKVDTFPAGADLSSNQYYLVKLNSSGQVVLSGNNEFAIGVLLNAPTSGKAAEVGMLGTGARLKVRAGGALPTPGTALASDATGRLKASATGAREVGVQVGVAGAAGDIIEIVAVGSHLAP